MFDKIFSIFKIFFFIMKNVKRTETQDDNIRNTHIQRNPPLRFNTFNILSCLI